MQIMVKEGKGGGSREDISNTTSHYHKLMLLSCNSEQNTTTMHWNHSIDLIVNHIR